MSNAPDPVTWAVMALTADSYRELTRLANDAGQNGWELVSVVPNLHPQPDLPDLQPTLWFKRRVP